MGSPIRQVRELDIDSSVSEQFSDLRDVFLFSAILLMFLSFLLQPLWTRNYQAWFFASEMFV